MKLFDPAGPEIAHPTPSQARQRSRRLRSRVTCGEVIDLYLRHQAAVEGFSAHTLRQVKRILDGFTKAHGPRPMSELFPFHLAEWVEANACWRKSGTRARAASAVNAALNWGVKSGRIGRNPLRGVHYEPSEPGESMPDDVLETYCRAAPKALDRVLRFLRYVGCRSGEAVAARWEDFDLTRGLWTVHKHKSRRKTRKPKVKVLVPAALALLQEIGPQPFGSVFLNNWRRPWKSSGSLAGSFDKLKERMGCKLPYTLHSIRHRFITAAIAAGAPMKAVGEQAGHSKVSTTERYVHMSTELDAVRAAAVLAQPKAL